MVLSRSQPLTVACNLSLEPRYIAALEARIKSLEADLRGSHQNNTSTAVKCQVTTTSELGKWAGLSFVSLPLTCSAVLEHNIAHEASGVESVAVAQSASFVTSEVFSLKPWLGNSGANATACACCSCDSRHCLRGRATRCLKEPAIRKHDQTANDYIQPT